MIRLALAALLLISLSGLAVAGLDEGLAAQERRDYATALQQFLPLAQQGDTEAQYRLGELYRWGHGVDQDETEAIHWLEQAASHGHAEAAHSLSQIHASNAAKLAAKSHTKKYELSPEVVLEQAEASTWLKRAADLGSEYAQWKLGSCYRQVARETAFYEVAGRSRMDAVRLASASEQTWVCSAWPNVDAISTAVRWIRAAADQGFSLAELDMARMYQEGFGVPKDFDLAEMWLLRTADDETDWAAFDEALFELGKLSLERGDLVEAYKWLNLASVDRPEAGQLRDTIAARMSTAQVAQAQALARAWRPRVTSEPSRYNREPVAGAASEASTAPLIVRSGPFIVCETLQQFTQAMQYILYDRGTMPEAGCSQAPAGSKAEIIECTGLSDYFCQFIFTNADTGQRRTGWAGRDIVK